MINLTAEHIDNVCKSGKEIGSCSFIVVGVHGLTCAKGTSLQGKALNNLNHIPIVNCDGTTGIIGRF